MSFLKELQRRNVIRVGIAYLVGSWLLLQIVDILVPMLGLPGWIGKFVFLMIAVGIIPVLIFSWAYEMTPDGLKPESEVTHDQFLTLQTAKKLDRVTIILLLVVAGMVVIDRFVPESGGPSGPPANKLANDPPITSLAATVPAAMQQSTRLPGDGRQSVAVLPFVNMSDDSQNEYFSDGISEELLNVLVRIKSLRVPSRTSSYTFKDSEKNLLEIGSALNVEHVLEGSVRKAGDRIRVTAQLIEVATDTHLWSETYTRELDDIFAVQDEIAQAIVKALQLTLTSTDNQSVVAHSTLNVEAYNKYLLGRHLWNQRAYDPNLLLAAIKPLREAVEIDPEYDQAWAALADTYILIPSYGVGAEQKFWSLGREAVRKALAINPNSARALAGSGFIKSFNDYDWEGANADFEHAIMLEPGYATAHFWYGTILNLQRRVDEALLQLQLARKADPMSVIIRHTPGYFLLWALHPDEAEGHFMDALELGQPTRWTIYNLDILHTIKGNYDEARRRVNQLAAMEGFDPEPDLARIDAIEDPTLKERALILLRERQDLDDGVFGKAVQFALLGEYESALESLEKGFAAGDPQITAMNYVKLFDPLRDNPRFKAMLKELNLLP